jgi:hypothetical protein
MTPERPSRAADLLIWQSSGFCEIFERIKTRAEEIRRSNTFNDPQGPPARMVPARRVSRHAGGRKHDP